ncbi:hypothetical protein WMY93_012998 [Mugilogobius chulae]|uniref:Uncharacterized protein n=1 Tax=Mugilogobius chulae TaxID=88201 RepID=A0AAW0P8S4_9GOBI
MSFVSLSLPSLPAFPGDNAAQAASPRCLLLVKTWSSSCIQTTLHPVRVSSCGPALECYVLSLFQMQNHTVTAWCALLAALAVMMRFLFFTVLQGGSGLMFALTPQGTLGVRLHSPDGLSVSLDPSSLPLLLYVSSVVFFLCCSAACLILHPHSTSVRLSLVLLVCVGRAVHQAGRALALSLYSSDSAWTKSAMGQRRLLQGGPIVVAFLLDLSPVARRLYTCSWNSSPAVQMHGLQVSLCVAVSLAALFLCCPCLSACPREEALLQDFSWRRAGLVRRLERRTC